MEFKEKLQKIQCELKAPKNLYNSFGKYKYRNAEGICEAVKPMLEKYKVILTLSDDVMQVGERYYIKATVSLKDVESDGFVDITAMARESLDKKGMDESQITGTASSYARKYALNGLFLLDDTKDADSDEYHNQTKKDDQPSVEKPKISDLKVKAIQAIMAKEKIDPKSVLLTYKIESFEDMTEEMFVDANNRFNAMRDETKKGGK